MNYRVPLNAYLVWLIMVAILSTTVRAQTIEVKSAHLRVLEGTEQERFLAAHNAARKGIGVDPVAWSDDLGRYAAKSLEEQKEVLIEAAKDGWAEGRVAVRWALRDTPPSARLLTTSRWPFGGRVLVR